LVKKPNRLRSKNKFRPKLLKKEGTFLTLNQALQGPPVPIIKKEPKLNN